MAFHNQWECHNNAHHKGCDRECCTSMRCPACHQEMMKDHDLIAKQKDQLTNTYLLNRGFTIRKAKNNLHMEVTEEMKIAEQKIADEFMQMLKAEGSVK